MSTLGVFCYVKDEERTLEQALRSIRPCADELVVIDTGSSDRSFEIASSIADKVVRWDWCDDFSKASNFGASLCNSQYLAKWDGDWVLRPSDQVKLNIAKQDGFMSKQLVELCWINEFEDDLTPIMLNKKPFIYEKTEFYWKGQAHDYLAPNNESLKNSFRWINNFKILNSIPENEFTQTYMNIWVYHMKEKNTEFSKRRIQTKSLIDSELEIAKGDEYLRLLFFAISNTLYNQQYDQTQYYLDLLAIENQMPLWGIEFQGLVYLYTKNFKLLRNLLDNSETTSPQLELLNADWLALHNHDSALNAYKNFVNKYHFSKSTINLNFKRMIDHPESMIQYLTI
jgi:glycosyltransferase involved in cell wall biosynthesis